MDVMVKCRDCDELINPQEYDCDLCEDCCHEKQMSWQDIANLTHETQVEQFGWCSCEEQEYFPYDDCPKTGE